MAVIVGGLRARLVHDSLYHMIKTSLTSLGWFDSGRQHRPINFVAQEIDPQTEIALNTLALADDNQDTMEWELGSHLSEHQWSFFVDFYAEDAIVGKHMAHDIKDILEGRMSAIGRTSNYFNIYDYSQATPPVIAVAEIDEVRVMRAHQFPEEFRRNWYSLAFVINDYYSVDSA